VHRSLRVTVDNECGVCDEFTREVIAFGWSSAQACLRPSEIEGIEVRRKKLVESIMEGVPASEVRDELNRNAARREELNAKLAAADEPRRSCTLESPTVP